jgi:hypothetical protein
MTLSITTLNAVKFCVENKPVVLNIVMLSVVILIVIMLNAVEPSGTKRQLNFWQISAQSANGSSRAPFIIFCGKKIGSNNLLFQWFAVLISVNNLLQGPML